MTERIKHPLNPIYDENCTVLILGTMPSPKSREANFYYSHPQNRFWRVISSVLGCDMPLRAEDKREMLLRYHIALWDVVGECDIERAADASIKNVIPNDIASLIAKTKIREIYTNGTKAYELYRKYSEEQTEICATMLPSTSPANASCSLAQLIAAYGVIADSARSSY